MISPKSLPTGLAEELAGEDVVEIANLKLGIAQTKILYWTSAAMGTPGRNDFIKRLNRSDGVTPTKAAAGTACASFETAAEPVLGPRGARTRGRPLQNDGFSQGHKGITSC
jgi:hypothetical protein